MSWRVRVLAGLLALLPSCTMTVRGQTVPETVEKLSGNLSAWMALLPDSTRLINLLLPGTHDAATDAFTISSVQVRKHLQCQSGDFDAQYAAGARCFDIRVADDLRLHHSEAATTHTLVDFLTAVDRWLTQHPTETVVMLLKRENGKERQERQWLEAVEKTISNRIGHRLLRHLTPETTLGEARGKCLLISREDFNGYAATYGRLQGGVQATWTDNPKASVETCANYPDCKAQLRFYLQDCYKGVSREEKAQLVKDGLLGRWGPAESYGSDAWGIYYASLAGEPQANAASINSEVLQFVKSHDLPKARGILFMDFLNSGDGAELALRLVSLNFSKK